MKRRVSIIVCLMLVSLLCLGLISCGPKGSLPKDAPAGFEKMKKAGYEVDYLSGYTTFVAEKGDEYLYAEYCNHPSVAKLHYSGEKPYLEEKLAERGWEMYYSGNWFYYGTKKAIGAFKG